MEIRRVMEAEAEREVIIKAERGTGRIWWKSPWRGVLVGGIDGNYPFSVTTASGVITITPFWG